jgi:hypothetical protein
MTWAELEAAAERRLAEKRVVQERHIRTLCDRLTADGYEAEVLEHQADGWQVRVRYPQSADVWISVRCQVADGRAQFEWCRWLPSISAAHDIDRAATYLNTLLGAGVVPGR